jgi:60 kDa SS-A/Ro ribonucleoprotein
LPFLFSPEVPVAPSYVRHVRPESYTQQEPLPGTNQEPNSGGGYSFVVDDWARLQRFLVLGTEGGTYYASEKKLTRENAACVERCIADSPRRTVDTIVDISVAGRAPKNDPAIFALALCASAEGKAYSPIPESPAWVARKLALEAIPKVCRTGTHLFQFVEAVNSLRGWGAGLRKAVAKWYTDKTPEDLAYQCTKYAQRNGWSHRDVLRLCHTGCPTIGHAAVINYAVDGKITDGETPRRGFRKVGEGKVDFNYGPIPTRDVPPLLYHVEAVKKATDAKEIARMVRNHKLYREVLPTQFLNSPDVWDALLHAGEHGMPLTALVRNLGKMTAIGLLAPLSEAEKFVVGRLGDPDALRHARVHPIALLTALKVYRQGRGDKGSLTWRPSPLVVGALDAAFYKAFGNITPTGKNFVVGVDVSGSMTMGSIAGSPLVPYEAAAAQAMVVARTEPWCYVGGFTSRFVDLGVAREDTFETALRKCQKSDFGSTDASVPIRWALDNRVKADCFVVITDNETNSFSSPHPASLLKTYRTTMNVPAKMAVFGLTATKFDVGDPNDSGTMSFVGFDTAAPEVLSEFVRQ